MLLYSLSETEGEPLLGAANAMDNPHTSQPPSDLAFSPVTSEMLTHTPASKVSETYVRHDSFLIEAQMVPHLPHIQPLGYV